ncbi:hypothetical protein ACFXJ8_07260 [Nonomuraea sp. NPDC059194]|uniref:hypothetical protein n=1 Tax=Nonomuraea sp. NPDC059194 TaxID=3346764 RepID=UPI00368268C6
MMTEEHSAAYCASIDQLNELREQAGNPSLSHLRKLSRRPLPNGEEGRELAPSTTQEILSGKRRHPPSWAWVVSFVVACHEAARKGNLDIGPVDVETWRSRWLHTRNADRAAATPDGRRVTALPAGGPAAMAPAELLTVSETIQCYRETHGRIGARLARLALNGDAEACFQLALLTLLRGWGHDGTEWLRRAVDAGHAGAMALQDSRDLREEAAAVAYQYGCTLEADGTIKTSIASYFYRLAAEIGHPQAVAKITPRDPQKRAESSAMPLAAPVTDVFADRYPPLLDDVFPDSFSYQLGTPWQETPPMINSGPEDDHGDSPPKGAMQRSAEKPMIRL